ncbi:MAG: transposase [Synergistaceae bacterium]|nr:transposase [Synergistaceae bacterium]
MYRFYPSSKICSSCFYVLPELPLSISVHLWMDGWTCPRCGAEHDRDINRDIKAAVNILRVGTSTLKGEDVRPVSICCLCRSYNPMTLVVGVCQVQNDIFIFVLLTPKRLLTVIFFILLL